MIASQRGLSAPSSATLGQEPVIPQRAPLPSFDSSRASAESEDVSMPDADDFPDHAASERRFIVAVDFGTTFSSVSFVSLSEDESPEEVLLQQIESIVNYPKDPMVASLPAKEIPTEIWYPKDRNFRKAEGLELADVDKGIDGDLSGDEQKDEFADDLYDGPDDDAGMLLDGDSGKFLWGYEIQNALRFPDARRDPENQVVSRFKLLLDTSEHTATLRETLEGTLRSLKKRKLVKKLENIIADYLTCLFRHTYSQLKMHHDFSDSCPIEFVLCVPAIWSPRACRIMQSAMATAMARSNLGRIEDHSVDNLFIVSEPEAAATFVLADTHQIKPGDTFVLLDAGGGTVDASTYTVDMVEPLRLKREEVKPGGDLCGSSYLNEAFRQFLKDKLKDETYLEVGDITIDGIVESALINDFETQIKRRVNIGERTKCRECIWIRGLRENREKKITKNKINLVHGDFYRIFMPLLTKVAALMKEQLRLAMAKNLDVKQVILIGGFAGSPSLEWYLREQLRQFSRDSGSNIRLIKPVAPGTAVASGAVLRALDKEHGPEREVRSSYGFLQTEHWEPEVVPAHHVVKYPLKDPLDGNKYVKTINWLIKVGEKLPARGKEFCLPVFHTFPANRDQRFLCQEQLYVSDTSTESHYRRKDPKNKGAELAGQIVADMTFLRTEGLIQPIKADREEGERFKRHYKVEFDLVMIVEGRNLRYEARYPRGEGGQVREGGRISIAAAFRPGTD